jgi:hypothetical protein
VLLERIAFGVSFVFAVATIVTSAVGLFFL